MALRIYIVRHAQPADQEPGYPGMPNAPLGATGRRQAKCVAGQLAAWGGVDAIYSSALQRALQTAEAVCNELRAPWRVWPLLGETGRRGWPRMRELERAGRYAAHVEETSRLRAADSEWYPPLSRLSGLYPVDVAGQPVEWPDEWHLMLEAETREKAYSRAGQAIDALKREYEGKDGTIAVVCHGAFGSVLMNVLLGCRPCDHNRFSQAHAAISRLDIDGDGAAGLRFLNYTGHMPAELVTEGVEW